MPVSAIQYFKFTSDTFYRSDLHEGTLVGSDKRWKSELFQDEKSTRAKLLSTELCRFLCDAPQPTGLIAKDEKDAFFLLTETDDASFSYDCFDLAEKRLASFWTNFFLDDEDALSLTGQDHQNLLNSSNL